MVDGTQMKQAESQWQQVSATMTERPNRMGSIESVVDKKLDTIANMLREEFSHTREIWDDFRR